MDSMDSTADGDALIRARNLTKTYWMGTPAQPDLAAKRQVIAARQLPALLKRVKALEKKLGIKPSE